MTENQNLYSGFFLECLPDNEKGESSVRVACFKPGTTFRKVLELTTKSPCKLKMGKIVDFLSLDGELTDKSRIQLKDNHEPIYCVGSVGTRALKEIWFIIQNHRVKREDIRSLHILDHPFLGEIKLAGFSLSPTRYKLLTIKVIVKENTFEIKLLNVSEAQEDPEIENNTSCQEVLCELKSDSPARLEQHFKPGDVLRFESEPNSSNPQYYFQNRHQKDLPLHSLTADDDPDTLKLQDVVDNHQVDAEKLRTLTDKGFAKIHLSDSQLLAVRMAMNENRPLVCIKGPPGTGKTFTLAHLIFRVLRSKMQAIVLTSTKEALQNLKEMTEKLLKERERELQVHEHAVMDLNTYLSLIDASEEAKVSVDQVEILKNVKVVFSTIESSFVDVVMQVESFKPFMCVIDEASQVLESQKWPTALKEKKLVLAGDPKQLPPFVKTQRERDMQPNQSVMERLWLKKEKYSWVMLSTQYRSVEEITDWSNSCFYDCRLKSCTKDLRRLVDDLNPKPEKSCFKLYSPMVHIDTSAVKEDPERVSTYEQRVIVVVDGEYEYSYSNKGEATYAMQHYKKLIDMGVQPERVAFLTPYRGQVILLGGMMEDLCKKYGNMDCKNTKIGTVDSVQGKEFDVVIFSSVRNNPQKNFGFVSEIRRLNVAVSRAKRHFALIGSGYMLTHNHSREVRRLFETIRNRFHPAILTGDLKKNVDYPPRNNFGLNFENFMRHSNDTKMIAWCEEFHKRGRDGL